jgi:hypothetical protein
MKLRPVNKQAGKILEKLTKGLEYATSRKIDNTEGTFMAVHVDRIGDDLYSVAHYYQQNGDMMADPDVVFWRRPDGWFPVEITQHGLGRYSRLLWVEKGEVVKWNPRAYNDCKIFCGTWMQNIKQQQGL